MKQNELTLLGGKTEYKQEYSPEVLESFNNKHSENDYWVRFNKPLSNYRPAGLCNYTNRLYS